MPSLFHSLGLFNRKNLPCAVLQGGVFFGMSIAASRALLDSKASSRDISTALVTLALTYGALSEKPYLWSFLLLLVMNAKTRDSAAVSTLPRELHLTISALSLFGAVTPWFRNDEEIRDVTPVQGV